MLSGRRSLVRARATKPGEVIELDHQGLLGLVQSDSEAQRHTNEGFHPTQSRVNSLPVSYVNTF